MKLFHFLLYYFLFIVSFSIYSMNQDTEIELKTVYFHIPEVSKSFETMPLLENILSDINVDKEEKCDLFFDTKESVEKEFGITIDDSLARKMSELIDKPTEAKIPRTVEKAVQI